MENGVLGMPEGAFANTKKQPFTGRWCRFAENKFCKVEHCLEMKSSPQGVCKEIGMKEE